MLGPQLLDPQFVADAGDPARCPASAPPKAMAAMIRILRIRNSAQLVRYHWSTLGKSSRLGRIRHSC